MPAKNKIGVSYSLFDGGELIKNSIDQIRECVDYINVGYQVQSYRFNPSPTGLEGLVSELLESGLVDEAYKFEPSRKERPGENELRKRNIGLNMAINAGCNYFLTADVDEFYRKDEFRNAIKFIVENDIERSAVPIVSYIKKPTYRIDGFRESCVPFISKINNSSMLGSDNKYGVPADPTRKMNGSVDVYHFRDIAMHHFGLVRKDIDMKFNNSSANCDVLRHQYENWEFGKKFRYQPDGYDISVSEVEDEFSIGNVI